MNHFQRHVISLVVIFTSLSFGQVENRKTYRQQQWTSDPSVLFKLVISSYTNAVYSVWLANGLGIHEFGNTGLQYDTSLVVLTNDGKGIVTKKGSGSGYLFDGPYYYQAKKHKVYDQTIQYSADFRLRIDLAGTLPENYQNDVVCTLQVAASRFEELAQGGNLLQYDTIIHSRIVYLREFIENSNGKLKTSEWKNFNTGIYSLNSLNQNRKDFQGNITPTGSRYSTDFMQYKLFWNGLEYIRLSLDSIFVYDCFGKEFFCSELSEEHLNHALDHFKSRDSLPSVIDLRDSSSIDNYLSVKKLYSILKKYFSSETYSPVILYDDKVENYIWNSRDIRRQKKLIIEKDSELKRKQ